MKDNVSLTGRLKIICAGDSLQSKSGVLHNCNIASRKWSLSSLSVRPVLDMKRHFAVFTATSALPLD